MSEGGSYTLIQTKLHIPHISSALVLRPRLIDRLNEGLEANGGGNGKQTFRRKLTLVTAPAGYGKTTLVASWLESTQAQVAWVSLDESDNNFTALIYTLVAAVRTLFPEECEETFQLLQATQTPPSEYMASVLINDIQSIPQLFVLALDDYHLIHEKMVNDLFKKLIDHQPKNLHLVLATRTDPLLPLPRLRASGMVTEMRRSDLRFKDDEAKSFLRQSLGLAIDDEAILALNNRAEGWIVGLRLAVLSIRGQRDLSVLLDRFQDQSTNFVNEYLLSEVLNQLPEAVSEFMLKTAILDRLNGRLCEAVTGVTDPVCDGQAYLEWMETKNLFVVSLDEQRIWYRYHYLFQTLLVGKLRAVYSTAKINSLHLKASQWFAGKGYIEEAIKHAIAANNVDAAVALVEHNSQNILNNLDRSTHEWWLAKLPDEILWQRPKLLIASGWLLFREWRLTPMEEFLDATEKVLETGLSSSEARTIQGHVAALRSVAPGLVGHDYSRCLDLATQALQQLPENEYGARSIAAGIKAVAQQALGNRDLAVQSLETIIQSPTQPGPSKIQALLGLATLHQLAGKLQPMSRVTDQFLALAAQRKHPNAIVGANKVAGWLNYEWNNLHDAAAQFSSVIEYRYQSNFVAYVDAVLGLCKVHLAQDEMEKAQELIDVLRADVLRLNNTALFGPIEAFQAQLWVMQGDMPAALRWARSVDPNDLHESILLAEVASLTHSRIMYWGGTESEVQTTVDFLHAKLSLAEAHYLKLRAIQIQIHLSVAYWRLGELVKALTMLEDTTNLAMPGGFIRAFLDAGRPVAELLATLRSRLPADSQPHLNTLLTSFESETLRIPLPPSAQLQVTESISWREVEVLQLMQARKSDREIADELVIAPATARRHASNIYRKLSVNNRRDAVRRAEMMGVISVD